MTGSCPKHMVMGPCGGVRADGRCEVVPVPCVFPAPAEWAEPVPAVPLRTVPMILTDFSSEPYSVRTLRSVARTLAPAGDAVLVGEHQDRPDFPPEGNHFPTSTGLHSLLRHADLDVLAVADSQDMPEPPGAWQDRTAAVERELQRRFGHTPQLAAATGQSHRIGHLLTTGQLTSQVILVHRA